MKSAIIFLLASVATTSTVSAQGFDLDKRHELDQMQVERICRTGLVVMDTKPMSDTTFMLCQLLKVVDRQAEKIKSLEEEMIQLRRELN